MKVRDFVNWCYTKVKLNIAWFLVNLKLIVITPKFYQKCASYGSTIIQLTIHILRI